MTLCLCTRPIHNPPPHPLLDYCKENKFVCLHEPLLTVQHTHFLNAPTATPPDIVLITSSNAIPALGDWAKHIPLWCVGRSTFNLAQENGFIKVYGGASTAQDLMDNIQQTYSQPQRILYVRGKDVHHDVSSDLGTQHQVDEVIVYQASPVAAFSNDFLRLLQDTKSLFVFLCSQRTSDIFYKLIGSRDHALLCQAHYFVISKAAATPLVKCGINHITIAQEPTIDSLVESVFYSLMT